MTMEGLIKEVLEEMKDEIESLSWAIYTLCEECYVSPERCSMAKIAKEIDPNYKHDEYFCSFDTKLVAEGIIRRAIQLTIDRLKER